MFLVTMFETPDMFVDLGFFFELVMCLRRGHRDDSIAVVLSD